MFWTSPINKSLPNIAYRPKEIFSNVGANLRILKIKYI